MHKGFDSNGSNEVRHTWAWSIAGGKVVCGLVPGGTPVFPEANRAALIDRLGNPGRACRLAFIRPASVSGSSSRRSSPRGTSASTRLVQPYLVAAATTSIGAPPGLFHVGSVRASQVKPPP